MNTTRKTLGWFAILLTTAGCAGADPAVAADETPGAETQVVVGPPNPGLLDGGIGIQTGRGQPGRPQCVTCTAGPPRVDLVGDPAHHR